MKNLLRRIGTALLALLGFVATAHAERTFQDFTIDLTTNSVELPTGVTQISYPSNGAQFKDSQHGWMWYAIQFAVDGAVKVTLEGCSYQSGYTGYITDASGKELAKLDNNACGATVSWEYKSNVATTLKVFCGQYCPNIKVEAIEYIDPTTAGLLWDYTETAPASNPDNGLYMSAGVVNDAAGTKNGLKGAKLNSKGYVTFTKAAVDGTLALSYGARDGAKAFAVKVSEFSMDGTTVVVGNLIVEKTKEGTEVTTDRIQLTDKQNNIYIERNSGSEGVLTKVEFIPNVPRSFVDFEMDLESLSSEYDTSTLPDGVTFTGTHDVDNHGYRGATITIPVDGPVKLTWGCCQYGNQTFAIKNSDGETVASNLSINSTKCFSKKDKSANVNSFIYTGDATTLTVGPIQYLSYFKAEATEVHECKVTYKDQNGTVLGEKDTFEGEAIGAIPYTVADITVPDGQAFRGWVYSSGVKANAADLLQGNTTVMASVTPVETVALGSVQNYNLGSKIFYPEDHETIDITDGAYYNEHGWDINPNGTISVAVAGNAQVVVGLCQYGSGTTFSVADANGNVVAENVKAKAEADGATVSFNYTGDATTLTLTFAAKTYVHKLSVYNVLNFVEKDAATGIYMVPANDGAAFVLAINSANAEGNAVIFLPNGTYDLGGSVKTAISAVNISIIGESMEGTIIKNTAPLEGIDQSATLLNSSTGLYLQDLTIQNAFDYYNAKGDGRAVCLQEKGNKTICKNVRLLSYQDTYYTNNYSGLYYWDNSEIHGTVDFICGGGDVLFNNTLIYVEKRTSAGTGECTITAPTTNTTYGYVFNNCTINSEAEKYNLGRTWQNTPKCVWLNTTMLKSPISTRWTVKGMNGIDPAIFAEYKSVDADGNNVTPAAGTQVTFTNKSTKLDIVLTDEQAAEYTEANMFGAWAPSSIAAQATADPKAIDADAIYLVENEAGEFVAVVKGSDFDATANAANTIRKANARGGFGKAVAVTETATDVNSAAADKEVASVEYYSLAGQKLASPAKGMNVVVTVFNDGSKSASKVLVK